MKLCKTKTFAMFQLLQLVVHDVTLVSSNADMILSLSDLIRHENETYILYKY